jgi:hypothetical protein
MMIGVDLQATGKLPKYKKNWKILPNFFTGVHMFQLFLELFCPITFKLYFIHMRET